MADLFPLPSTIKCDFSDFRMIATMIYIGTHIHTHIHIHSMLVPMDGETKLARARFIAVIYAISVESNFGSHACLLWWCCRTYFCWYIYDHTPFHVHCKLVGGTICGARSSKQRDFFWECVTWFCQSIRLLLLCRPVISLKTHHHHHHSNDDKNKKKIVHLSCIKGRPLVRHNSCRHMALNREIACCSNRNLHYQNNRLDCLMSSEINTSSDHHIHLFETLYAI